MNITSQRISLPEFGFWLIIVSYLLLMFGSPMPIKIGAIEIVMGVGLTVGVSLLAFPLIVRKDKKLLLPTLCILYLLLAPLLIGVVRGNNFSDIARDVAPLLFLTVFPLVLSQDRSMHHLRALLAAVFAVGLVSAVQFHIGIVQQFGSMGAYISRYGFVSAVPGDWEGKLNVALRSLGLVKFDYQTLMIKCQDPSMLFSAIYLLCLGLGLVMVKPRRPLLGLLALGGGALCAYEFSALGMRAFEGFSLLALIIYLLHLVIVRKLPLGNLIVTGIFGLILTYSQITNFATQLWVKTQANGLNGRSVELYAVFDTILESVKTLLFGIGWGGVLSNPIYVGATTRFTHSLISFWLLKTGLLGFAVLVLFVILLCRRINLTGIWTSSHRLAVFLAASAVIAIGLFLEPTYKMLSFGMIVGLLLAAISLPTTSPSLTVRR